MRLYIDLDTNRLIRAPGISEALTLVEFKRGDDADIDIYFVRGLERQNLPSGATGKFMLKELTKFDGAAIVEDDWVVVDVSGSEHYSFAPNFNTVPLNTLLASGDADDSNDEPYVDLLLEISWLAPRRASTGGILTARVYNDVIKGDEAIPAEGDPPYPSSTDINEHLAAQAGVDDPHGMDALLAAKADLASPAFEGTPTAPTAAVGTNTDQLATTAFIQAALAALVDSSPAALDTLNELAAALGDDPNFAATVTNALATKVAIASIVNDLITGGTDVPLAAAQGVVLKGLVDGKLAKVGDTATGEIVLAGGARRTNASTFGDQELLTVRQLYDIIGGFGQVEYVSALRNCTIASSGTGNANSWKGGDRWNPTATSNGDKVILEAFTHVNAGTGSGTSTYFVGNFSVGFFFGRILNDGHIMRVNIGQLPSLGIAGAAEMSTAIRGAQLEVRNVGGVYEGRFNFADATNVQLGAWAVPVANPINGGGATAAFPSFGSLNRLDIEVKDGVISLVSNLRQPGNGSIFTNRYWSTTIPTSSPNMVSGSFGSQASLMTVSFERVSGTGSLPEIGSFFIKYPFKF